MHLAGHGRNEIVRLLTQQGLHISEGSVGNIVRSYRKRDQPLQNASTNNTNSSITPSEVEQATTNVTIHRNGGPLWHLINGDSNPQQDMNNFEQKDSVQKQEEDIDFADTPYPDYDIYIDPDAEYDPRLDDLEGERYFTHTPNYPNVIPLNTGQQIPEFRRPDVQVEDNNKYNHVSRQNEESNQPPLRVAENSSESVGIDWDSEEAWDRRFVRILMNDKRERQQEFQLLEQQRDELQIERHNLNQVSQNIDQRENDLRMREAKIKEAESLLPSVRELQRMDVTFQIILPYIMAINEKAMAENIDLTTSAYNLVQDIRQYREIGYFTEYY